ncbi:cyclopropane-fatty-acyl-phospholipid synthase, partial [Striga asiatica]
VSGEDDLKEALFVQDQQRGGGNENQPTRGGGRLEGTAVEKWRETGDDRCWVLRGSNFKNSRDHGLRYKNVFGAKPTQNASWLWRSWLKVRNGRKTKIWEHLWVPNLSNQKLLSKNSNAPNITWVSELIPEDSISWTEDLPRRCFSNSECGAILQIKTLSNHLQDRAEALGSPLIQFWIVVLLDPVYV